MRIFLASFLLLPFGAFAGSVSSVEAVSNHVIPTPKVLQNGVVTVCTADGKCSKFSANSFAVVPRVQLRRRKVIEALPDIKQPAVVNNTTVVVNVQREACEGSKVRVVRVPVELPKKKNLVGLTAGYGPIGVKLSNPNVNSYDYDLDRGLVGGISYYRRVRNSSLFLGLQGYSNGTIVVGPQVEF